MGRQDYMFLRFVKKIVKYHKSSRLVTLQNSGHVVNVDQPDRFNKGSWDERDSNLFVDSLNG